MRDILATTATSGFSIVCLMAVTWLLASWFGPEGFGAYSVARRVLTVAEPVATLGVGIALTRYLAISSDHAERVVFFQAGFVLVLVPAILIGAFGWWFQKELSVLVFGGQSTYQALWLATLFLVIGNSLFILLYSYYRGTGQMRLANLWQAGVIGIGPLLLVAVVAQWKSEAIVIYAMAGLMYLAAVPIFRLVPARYAAWKWSVLSSSILMLSRYSLPRVPGLVAFGGILAVGPLLAPYIGSLQEAGFLVVGQSLLRMVESGTDAFGRVALPRFTQLFSKGGGVGLRNVVQKVLCFTFDNGLFLTVQLVLLAPWLTTQWLGPEFVAGVDTVRVTLLSLLPYLLFVMLKPILDAIEPRAVVTSFVLVALGATLLVIVALIALGIGSLSLAVGTTVGIFVLGGFMLHRVLKDFEISLRHVFSMESLLLCLLLGLPWLVFVPPVAGAGEQSALSNLGVILLEGVIGLVYLSFLWWRRCGWLHDIRSRLQGNPSRG